MAPCSRQLIGQTAAHSLDRNLLQILFTARPDAGRRAAILVRSAHARQAFGKRSHLETDTKTMFATEEHLARLWGRYIPHSRLTIPAAAWE